MKHLLTILNLNVLDQNNNIIYSEKSIKNTIHVGAEIYLLSVAFNTAANITVPTNYYVGLDNRTTIAVADTFTQLQNEPSTNGYSRYAISSANGFVIALNQTGVYQATTNVITFGASGGSFGPIRNAFLATTINNTGYLLASAAFASPQTLSSGQKISFNMGITLKDC